MNGTYWNDNGKFQQFYDATYNKLVPSWGVAATKDGEIVRLISKIYYRYYNDGDTYESLTDPEEGMFTSLYNNSHIHKEDGEIVDTMLLSYTNDYEKLLEKCVDTILTRIMERQKEEEQAHRLETAKQQEKPTQKKGHARKREIYLRKKKELEEYAEKYGPFE
jgi:hypothetical protein